MPTVVVAIVIAAVTLGGIGLDKVIAAPSAGIVNIGGSVTIHAAPGWVRVDTGSDQGVTLQNADVRLMAAGAPYDGTATAMLTEVRKSLTDQVDQIAFGEEQDGTLAGHEAALIGFEAISSGSGGGTIDGEVICLIDAGNGILFEVVAPQGSLDNAVDDIKTMAASIEVGQ
jgi:hypothetical protein